MINSDQKSELLHIDLRGPSHAADCLDCVVAFPLAVDEMRAAGDALSICDAMTEKTRAAFEAAAKFEQEGLLFIAAAAQDLLYRYTAGLAVMDSCTRAYCSFTIRDFFFRLSAHGIRTFYILDNTLREDRFQAVLELFELSGITTVTPRRDGSVWAALDARLRAGLNNSGHVAYIEPDSAVNFLDAARQLARELPCVATFRNLAPDDPEYEIVNIKATETKVLPQRSV